MKLLKVVFVLTMAVGLASFSASCSKKQKQTFITIGTGGMTGVYYPTGGAIAKVLSKNESVHGIRATVQATGASVFNVNAIMKGDMDFGITQSDRQFQAYNGLDEWEGKPQKDLRAVFSLAPEAITLVVSDESKIKELGDIKGKIINIGNPGSGNRQNAIDVIEAMGLDVTKDIKAEGVKAADAPRMMQDGRIDGFFYTVGHPNGNIKEATAGLKKARLVNIVGMDKVLAKFPYYSYTTIPKSFYPEALNDGDTKTIGLLATFVTHANTPDEVVYNLTKQVFENLDDLKTLHPALEAMSIETMLKGNTAPYHPGAIKYYKEAGLMKE